MSLQAPIKNLFDDIIATENYAHHKNKCITDRAAAGTGKIVLSNVNFTNFVYDPHTHSLTHTHIQTHTFF